MKAMRFWRRKKKPKKRLVLSETKLDVLVDGDQRLLDIQSDIVDIFGLRGKLVKNITLSFPVDSIAEVNVEMYLECGDAQHLVELTKKLRDVVREQIYQKNHAVDSGGKLSGDIFRHDRPHAIITTDPND